MDFSMPTNLFNDPNFSREPESVSPIKYLYFDVETTGLNPIVNDVVQFSAISDIDGVPHEIDLQMRPTNISAIDSKALKVQNRSRAEVLSWPNPYIQYAKLESWLGGFVNKFDPLDKFIPVAFNATFDLSFWKEHSIKMGVAAKFNIGSWINRSVIQDPLAVIRFLERVGIIPKRPTHNLSDLCNYFGFPIDKAHDSMSDTRALRKLDKFLFALVRDHFKTFPTT